MSETKQNPIRSHCRFGFELEGQLRACVLRDGEYVAALTMVPPGGREGAGYG